MSKGRRPRRAAPAERGRPSMFFVIALAIGVAFLAWAFVATVRSPVRAPQKAAPVAPQR